MSSGGAALQPTFNGHVSTTQDALILFEACLQGHLSHVPRRPHDRERSQLIRSGSVFIYEENASGIKRWTDGVTWSPSRILGNFLVYRELDKPFPPGEKKRAMKKQTRRPSRPGEPYARTDRPNDGGFSPTQPGFNGERQASDVERQLIGSLIDSYGFKVDGLVKKTMSVTVQGVTHHLVSYYNVNDVMNSQLRTPGQTDNLQYIRPRPELTSKQSFRSPIEEAEEVDGLRDGQSPYGYRMGGGYVQDYKSNPYGYMPQQYPPMASQPPLNTSYPGPVPPMTSPYLHTSIQTSHMPQDRSPYGTQYDHNAYSRSYDSMNNNMPSAQKSVPPTPTSGIPPSLGDRQQPPNMMYPPSNVQRPMSAVSPVSMDSRNNIPYRGGGYQMPAISSPVDAQRPPQPSPVSMKYEDRRETQSQTPTSYSGPRPGDYPYNPNHNMPQGYPAHSAPLGQQWNPQHSQQ